MCVVERSRFSTEKKNSWVTFRFVKQVGSVLSEAVVSDLETRVDSSDISVDCQVTPTHDYEETITIPLCRFVKASQTGRNICL